MHFLWSNTPILRIARRFRMNMVGRAGEVDARLELPPPSVASRTGEYVTEAVSLYDRAQKALAAIWNCQRGAGTPTI